MSTSLLLAIGGLALVDSLNPATLVAVALILLGSRHRPGLEAFGVVVGAFVTVFAVGLTIYLGASAAAESVSGALVWLRRGAFGLAAVVLLVSAIRSLRTRQRSAVGLPHWFNPLTAVGLGFVMTGADLPNAFPYFIAIERLVDADSSLPIAMLVLAAYGVIYCIPCLILLAIGLSDARWVRRLLGRLHDRFGSEAEVPANRWKALALLGGAVLMAGIAVAV